MSSRALRIRVGIVALLCIAAILLVFSNTWNKCEDEYLCVYYLDVGQGDATLIESPTGTQLLIDGGRGSGVLRALGKNMSFFDRTIDVVLATHPDEDHIGGLIDVLKRYRVGAVMMTENEGDTPAAQVFRERVTTEGAEVMYVRRGQSFELGGGAVLTVLFPDRDPSGFESNTSSIVSRLAYGETGFIFTGDAPQAIEEYLVSLGSSTLHSNVLKAGHHGSKTSTSPLFVEAVAPEYAIISAGKDNKYGHPHEEVMKTLESAGVTIESTITDGTIVLMSDGRLVTVDE